MMDEFVDGFISGILGPPLGSFLGRFKYPVVIGAGLVVGAIVNVIFAVYEIIFSGGLEGFLSTFRAWEGSHVVIILFFPTLCAIGLTVMRAINRPPTVREAQEFLENEGYLKTVENGGQRVKYTKDEIAVIFTINRRYDVPSAEWWRQGRRKGSILLSNPD